MTKDELAAEIVTLARRVANLRGALARAETMARVTARRYGAGSSVAVVATLIADRISQVTAEAERE